MAGRLIFGGTFDPPHRAHLELPRHAAAAVGADRIVYVPAARNPLKAEGAGSAPEHRHRMLELALAGREDSDISTIELDRGGRSYFVETLAALVAAEPGAGPWRFLIGADHALDFHRWHDWERILEVAEPVVLARPPHGRVALAEALAETYDADEAAWWTARIVEAPVLDVSATEVRAAIAAGGDVRGLVPDAVVAYAREHRLYDA